jgi:hypothetical protein
LRERVLWAQQSSAMLDGRFAEFWHFSAEALHFGEALGNADAVAVHRADAGTVQYLRGEVDEACERFRIGAELLAHPCLKVGVALAEAELGRRSEAAALLAGLGAPSVSWVPRDYLWLFTHVALAGACGPLGDRELAAAVHDVLLPHRGEMALAQVSAFGPVAHFLGVVTAVLGRPDEADGHFAFACDLMERTGVRGLLPRTRLEWARLLLARSGPGDAERARTLAAAARGLADELDAPTLADRAEMLLAAAPA